MMNMGKFAFVSLGMLALIALLPITSDNALEFQLGSNEQFVAQVLPEDPLARCLFSCDEAMRLALAACDVDPDPASADECRRRLGESLPLCHQRCIEQVNPSPAPAPTPPPPPSPNPPTGCLCPADYNPVCGTDGATYNNSCAATCANVQIAYPEACRPPAPPPPAPVVVDICKETCNKQANQAYADQKSFWVSDSQALKNAQEAYNKCYAPCSRLSSATEVDPNAGLKPGDDPIVGTRCTQACNDKKTDMWDPACGRFDFTCKASAQNLYMQCLQACTEVGPLVGAEGERYVDSLGTYIPAPRENVRASTDVNEDGKIDENDTVKEVAIYIPGTQGEFLFFPSDAVPPPEELREILEEKMPENPVVSSPVRRGSPASGDTAGSGGGSPESGVRNISIIQTVWSNILDFVGGLFGGDSSTDSGSSANVAQPVNLCPGGGSQTTRNTPLTVQVRISEDGGSYYVGSSGQAAQDIDRSGYWEPAQIKAVVKKVNEKCKTELRRKLIEKAVPLAEQYCTSRCLSGYQLSDEKIRGCNLPEDSKAKSVNVVDPGTADAVWVAWNKMPPVYRAQVSGSIEAKITLWCPGDKYPSALPTGTAPPPPPTFQLNQVNVLVDVKTKDGSPAIGWSHAELAADGYAAFISRTQYLIDSSPVEKAIRDAIAAKTLPAVSFAVTHLHTRANGTYYVMEGAKEVEKKYWGSNPGVTVQIIETSSNKILATSGVYNPTTKGSTLAAQRQSLIDLIQELLIQANVTFEL